MDEGNDYEEASAEVSAPAPVPASTIPRPTVFLACLAFPQLSVIEGFTRLQVPRAALLRCHITQPWIWPFTPWSNYLTLK